VTPPPTPEPAPPPPPHTPDTLPPPLPPGINRSQSAVVDLGKGDFVRYAESGQILIDRSRHLGAWRRGVWRVGDFI
jgi:hypothetical protein